MWGCAQPDCPRAISDGAQCTGCRSLTCLGCRHEGVGISLCKYCVAFVCLVGECSEDPENDMGELVNEALITTYCDVCDDPVCFECAEYSWNLKSCEACDRRLCRDCEQEPGAGYSLCQGRGCYSEWCPACAPDALSWCTGSGRQGADNKVGCGRAILCLEGCMDSDDAYMYYTHCVGCGGRWCEECCPLAGTNVYCTGPGADDDTDPCDGYFSGFCKVGRSCWLKPFETRVESA